MTTAPNAAAAGLPGTSTHACAATSASTLVGGGSSIPAASALPIAASTPSVGASLIGGGTAAGNTVAPGASAVPIAGGLDTTTIASLAQLALAATTALGASTIGGASPLPAGTSLAGPMNTATIFGFDPSIPLANGATLPTSIPTPLAPEISITAGPGLLGTEGAPVVTTGANAAPAPAAAATSRPLTSLAPGGNAQDAQLVERALGVLRQSQSGAQVVDRLLAVGAKINVISDEEFAAMGHDGAHAFYDPKIDTMFMRRSDLADDTNVKFAAVALAHEGTHLLDDVSGIGEPVIQEISNRVAAAGGLNTAAGAEAREQGLFELTMIKETRAFLFAGSVARELGLSLPANDPTSTAIAGANDQATYNAVWQRLLQSSYNDQGRTATPRNL